MKRALGLLVVASFAIAIAIPATASAEGPPSRWERAKDPEKIEDYKLHRSVQRTFPLIEDFREHRTDIWERIGRDLVFSLDSWNAAESNDVRLRVDLGHALHEHKEHRRAVEVLKSAAKMDPHHPAMEEGWLYLGLSCGYIGDHACEREAYLKVLEWETEDARRLTATLNLAEVEMHLGNLKESIALYEETLRTSGRLGSSTTNALAEWGIAVAYDRTGDRNAAERAAKRAIEISNSIRRDVLHDDGVFYYPEYEVFYYEGVGAATLARNAASAHDAAIFWALAERKFDQYVRGAEAKDPHDRFLGAARSRLASAKAEREKAEKRRLKEPIKRTDDEELPL